VYKYLVSEIIEYVHSELHLWNTCLDPQTVNVLNLLRNDRLHHLVARKSRFTSKIRRLYFNVIEAAITFNKKVVEVRKPESVGELGTDSNCKGRTWRNETTMRKRTYLMYLLLRVQ